MRFALLLALLLITAGCIYLFVVHPLWFPAGVSVQAPSLDHRFKIAFSVLGGLFIAAQITLAIVLVKGRKTATSSPSTGDWRLELIWTVAIAALFFWFNVSGQKLWSKMMHQLPSDTVQVEVTGAQFQWYFRYPGTDGRFGRTDAQKLARAEEGNPLGIDPADPAGADDVVSNVLVLPANRNVELRLRAQDVIHSLFIPAMRFKQDAVPGMEIHSHIEPSQPGTYEIACAELCGTGHYRMRAQVRVLTADQFAAWLKAREAKR